ncbi:MAG: acyl-CoA dehydrogenase family protein [Rhodobacter sp.]|nr:acyl-CoA dehydrogenase family protein [Paracoccaceae bacterium]MCB1408631.1 acyl-CoA dehydrogenase family protein [Paracoccaceae bacterium]MCC0080043.1 acyl-CoA dehydrogenase family protein [Rhodobacter sp.]
MTDAAPRSDLGTHEVHNQPPMPARDPWAQDATLRAALGDDAELAALGRALASDAIREAARDAQTRLPELRTFDRAGRRIDEVHFHPGYHRLMALGLEAGYAATAWDGTGSHLRHAAINYMMSQVEPGVCCPMTMTYAGVPALAADPALAALWRPRLVARGYQTARVSVDRKGAATLGMAMTEKQGGSDVRANGTRAVPDGEGYRLFGHKWFCSAPMCDGFLTLAQLPEGLTCFLVPRWLPDDTRNPFTILRLKDKLGNKANASSEIEYDGTYAHRLGAPGRGVQTIIEMVHHTRLDTAMAPAGLMRAALSEAVTWARGRSVFQKRLIDQPLMRAVLTDLAIEAEAALQLALDVARAFDDPARRPYARLSVALAKFLSNKRAPAMIYECMECLGGMGYVEDTPMPMLYREAPLNSIWEGSGNVICLDILRTLVKDPDAAAQLDARLDAARGQDPRYDAALADHRDRWPALPPEAEARWFAESLATLLTGAVMMAQSPVADAWLATRLGQARGGVAGAIAAMDGAQVLDRL